MKKWLVCLLVLCLLPLGALAAEADYLGVWRGGQEADGVILEHVIEFTEDGIARYEMLLNGFSLGVLDMHWVEQDGQLILYQNTIDEENRIIVTDHDGLLHLSDATGVDIGAALGREGSDDFGAMTELELPDPDPEGTGMAAATRTLPLCLSVQTPGAPSDLILAQDGNAYIYQYTEEGYCSGIRAVTWTLKKNDTVLLSTNGLGDMTLSRWDDTVYELTSGQEWLRATSCDVPELYTALMADDSWHFSQLDGATFSDPDGNAITFSADGSFHAQVGSDGAPYSFEYLTELDGSIANWHGRVLFYDDYGNCLYIRDDTLYIPTDGKPMTFAMRKDVYEGQLTDTIAWAFSDGMLTITGSGEIPDYEEKPRKGDPVLTPWFFFRDQITHVEVGEGITRIGNEAFAEAGCTSASLPSTLRSLGNEAFYWSQLDTLVLPEGLERIGHGCFQGSTIREIVIPDTVTEMEGWAFAYCKLLENIKLSGSQKVLRNTTFYMCNSLKELHLPASIQTVENYAIYDCPFLESIYYANPSIDFKKDATKDSKRARRILEE